MKTITIPVSGGGGCLEALQYRFKFLKTSQIKTAKDGLTSKKGFTLAEDVTDDFPLRKNKYAFTLAEVLITLTIIGIVAALTMPNIIAKYQSMVLKNQFKKAYSLISQAINKAEFDIGGSNTCYYGDVNRNWNDCIDLMNSLKKNLKIVKSCEGEIGNSYEMGCMPKYNGMDTVVINNGGTEEEQVNVMRNLGYFSSEPNGLVARHTYVLTDGMLFITYFDNSPLAFAIDVNGKKGPNKWGYDLFYLNLTKANDNINGTFRISPQNHVVEKGGKTSVQMLIDID